MSGLGTRHSFLSRVTAVLPIHLVTYMIFLAGASGAPEPRFLSEDGASFTNSQGSVKVGDGSPKDLCLVPGR